MECNSEYEKFSEIVKWKILILKYGVTFEPVDLFSKYENIDKYKVKYRKINVQRKNFEVYDVSKDKTVIPSEILLRNEEGNTSIVKLRYAENSIISMGIKNDEIYLKMNNKKANLKIQLVKKESVLKERIPKDILKNNSKIGDYIDIVGIDRISILFFEGCYNWLNGKPCKFCDLHPKKEDEEAIKPTLNDLKKYDFSIEKWWKAKRTEYLKGVTYSLKRVLKEKSLKHVHIFFMAGNLPTNTDVWNVVEDTISYISKEVDLSKYDSYLNIAPHDKIERLVKVKEYGIKQIQYNLEIVNEDNFNFSCPGKMEYKVFLEKILEATNIYKNGTVRSNFVLGLDDIDETLKFANKIAKKGVVFDYSVFQPKKNTPYSDKEPPDFDKVIEFTEKLVEIYQENKFKPIFCSLSSRSSLVNELFERGEDYDYKGRNGKWKKC